MIVTDLPIEILSHILTFCDRDELKRFLSVHPIFKEIIVGTKQLLDCMNTEYDIRYNIVGRDLIHFEYSVKNPYLRIMNYLIFSIDARNKLHCDSCDQICNISNYRRFLNKEVSLFYFSVGSNQIARYFRWSRDKKIFSFCKHNGADICEVEINTSYHFESFLWKIGEVMCEIINKFV